MNHKIIRDPDTGLWWGCIDDDCIVQDKSPEYVAGYIDCYLKLRGIE